MQDTEPHTDMGNEDINQKIVQMRANAVMIVERGSVVYGTITGKSDIDVLAIVPDEYQDLLSNYENGILEANAVSTYLSKDEDWEFITLSDFKKMALDHTVLAMETLCTPWDYIRFCSWYDLLDFKKSLLPLDKWKIRQQFSSTASNSWAKAHKKMTVEKDLDMYRGQKSLFHSLRILMFAIQLCERENIYNFGEARHLWYEIYDPSEKTTWEEYKKKYRPLYNSLRSKLAELAPKPKNS